MTTEPPRSALLRALELARSLAEGREPGEVLEAILDSAIELTGGERGFVVEERGGELHVLAARNYGRRGVPQAEARVSRSVVRRAFAEGAPIVVARADQDVRFTGKSVTSLKLRSVLVAPLDARGKPLAAVVVEDRRRDGAFTDSHRKLLELVSAHAALALEAARARAKLEQRLEETESQRAALERDLALARGRVSLRHRFDRLVGASEPMLALLARLDRFCDHDAPVLIEGESGTGKELVARALHEQGKRRAGRFVALELSALPQGILEAELFGHAIGAFTGADSPREGLLRQAEGGTLLLDEVGEMPRSLQGKLLRFLEEKTVRAVGGDEVTRVSVRVLASTQRDLRALVRSGDFREDLFFRLNVLSLRVPPLRERRGDVPRLASHCRGAAAAGTRRPPRRLSREALAALERHSFPGNVRELENAIRRACALGGNPIAIEDLDLEAPSPDAALGLEELERDAARRALDGARGSVARAASLLGIHRTTLYRKLRAWGLRK
ncbi:sigma-54-dependent Fis family transcriptional regulator [bacterium]|nr:sigma-54-dependent Fis family transcriptional regulator [bacterium]